MVGDGAADGLVALGLADQLEDFQQTVVGLARLELGSGARLGRGGRRGVPGRAMARQGDRVVVAGSPGGVVLLSDDGANRIYRISYVGP